jgi:hypothetical protein
MYREILAKPRRDRPRPLSTDRHQASIFEIGAQASIVQLSRSTAATYRKLTRQASGVRVTIRLMSAETAGEEHVDQFIVYGGYGNVMHQLQGLELTLWGFLTTAIKPGTSLDQGMKKVEKWNGTTIGNLVRGLKNQSHWPAGLVEQLEMAVEIRNYLAHHFLREYFAVAPSQTARQEASQWLADVSTWLESVEEELEAHQRALGIAGLEDLDEYALAEIDKLRPTEWLRPGS